MIRRIEFLGEAEGVRFSMSRQKAESRPDVLYDLILWPMGSGLIVV
jgi:hypothetical protein